jgi:hypothetical protein
METSIVRSTKLPLLGWKMQGDYHPLLTFHASPPIGSNVEEIVIGNARFLAWDAGDQESPFIFISPGALAIPTWSLK